MRPFGGAARAEATNALEVVPWQTLPWEPSHSTAIAPMLASLRVGRKINPTPEIDRSNDNNTLQIRALPIRLSAPSGNPLREAGQPLRERAGREKLCIRHRCHIAYRIDFC